MYKWALRFLCWYICVLFVQPQNRFYFLYAFHLADIAVMGALGCHFFAVSQGQSTAFRLGAASKLGIILLTTALLSMLGGAYMTWLGWNSYIDIMAKSVLIMFLIEAMCDTPQKVWVVQTAVVLATLWWIKGGIRLSAAGATFSGDRLMGPAVSLIENPNGFAYMLCTVIPLYLYFYQQSKSKVLKITFLVIALFAVHIVLETGSRTGLLCLIAIGIFLFPKYGAQHKKALIVGGVAILLIMSSVGSLNIARFKSIPQAFHDFMSSDEEANPDMMDQDEQSAWERGMKNKHTWRLIKDNPILGAGVGADDREFPYPMAQGQVHCEILMAGRMMGFPGMMIYIAMLASMYLHGQRIQTYCKGWWPSMADMGWTFKMQTIAFVIGGSFSPIPFNAPMLIVVGCSSALWMIVQTVPNPFLVPPPPAPVRKPKPFAWGGARAGA